MISMATILDEIISEMSDNLTMGVNWKVYQDKIKKFDPTYLGMMDDFCDNVIGQYLAVPSIEHLQLSLAQHAWKYFDQ